MFIRLNFFFLSRINEIPITIKDLKEQKKIVSQEKTVLSLKITISYEIKKKIDFEGNVNYGFF